MSPFSPPPSLSYRWGGRWRSSYRLQGEWASSVASLLISIQVLV
jgi:hypothetical protein